MAQDFMHYDQLTQSALRHVIKGALNRVAKDGLPGSHHFYITFLTRFPGVDLDEQLAKKYPDDITIVLENQFWDLEVEDEFFEVTLKFSGVPKYLKVPFEAVTRFHDPSVGFALQFEVASNDETLAFPAPAPAAAPAKDDSTPPEDTPPPGPKPKTKKKTPTKSEEKSEKDSDNIVSLDAFRKK